ncbi:hypothetical protein PCURB6_03230 [Paenibacillus curdlanolyticus]|nr:carbamoyltransferase C-terminal domain-containing protein [Paenibacillus curdlanolyticus]GFN30063.1 hypothetical protein PCURB6_03230 [Paenibacillus curdlanolyticus]
MEFTQTILQTQPSYYTKYKDRIKLYNHHLSHAASTYYPSPFNEAAVLVIDGSGSIFMNQDVITRETTTFYFGSNKDIREIKKTTGLQYHIDDFGLAENSVGFFYLVVTKAIGFGFAQEGKTMGLAPYGTNKYTRDFEKFYTINDCGEFKQSKEDIEKLIHFCDQQIQRGQNEDSLFQIKADLAYAVQYHTEQIVIKMCLYLNKITNSKNLCIAGGVGLNSVMNYKILNQTPFEHIFIQPAAGDAGTAIGSALLCYYESPTSKREIDTFTPYLGRHYHEDEIKEIINLYLDRVELIESDKVLELTAELIAEGNIVGWFQGRSEIGPRALGNRSILADPRKKDMKDIINARIKHREPFRPFAPVVLEEKQTEYFCMEHPSYYMLLVPEIRKDKVKEIPSVTHVDITGRVQTVSKEINPLLHNLVMEFYKKTETAVLLNTSFNDNNEPIVESPVDAIECFLKIDLDYLIIDKFVLKKRGKS